MITSKLLDALPIAAALVARGGVVEETNAAWRALGPHHRVPCPAVGGNVLQALDPLALAGDGLAHEVRAAFTQVLAGVRTGIEIDYDLAPSAGGGRYRLDVRALDDQSCVATHVDVSRHWRAIELAERAARQDPLTGLANRRGLGELLDAAIHASANHPAVLALVDLDDFKGVNDRHGHGVGDQLLQRVARRLTRSVRTGDVVARLGGDEFVVLARGMASTDAVTGLVERLRDALEAPIQLGARPFHVEASIGAVLLDGGIADGATALALADQRMYRDKRQRRTVRLLERSA